ncbi:uncharacterized protein LOC110705828 [Chenopodium quinoa]|uniref:uncharacterized protein LOC110705828 n=1 Tax=Chenopodium quinoa TaxID=63459 RepID=UPI000B7979F7|nr:uncharacterized protein LOC110705828 [Chenopodium quinoa]
MLAYGTAPDAVDEYLRLGQTTTKKALQHFCQGVITHFEANYLRSPTYEDLRRILHQNEMRGFPGMIVNDHEYNLGYYLADDIYPRWATFIQGITLPQLRKDKLFADKQAAARKDVERAFGVLQARFAILRQPSLAFDEDILCDIMKACIIMHNMIVEDERQNYTRAEVLRRYYEEDRPQSLRPSTSATVNNNEPFEFNVGRPPNVDFDTYVQRRTSLRDRETHVSLKADLVEHIWKKYGSNDE